MIGSFVAMSSLASAVPQETGADLEVVVTNAGHTLPEGATASASVLVGNLGPGTSPFVLSVNLGGGLEFVAATGDGWSCTSGQDFECTVNVVPEPLQIVPSLFIDVRRTAPGNITATLVSGNDPQSFNNRSVYDVLVDQEPTLCDGCPPPIGVPLDIPLPETGAPEDSTSVAALTLVILGVALVGISRRRSST